ncbi:alpha/beta hydrolase [[Mycobacterium] nativiensis]|uniref:Alpha/beta hydrolase n=1 Tax=[Mycobacterium] nativiensis TaxID=2855503 RepID=A0ABU5XUY1_9MYCO|nr:alpha/beta hydrolase [Mycolicibacter sp. MYC340]MEB3031801.1 alpha/beta hydrolase [Mycolicibacter sp. MYC340]
MALDEATAAFLTQMGEGGSKPLHEMSPEEARGLGAELAALYGEGPDMHRFAELSAPGIDGYLIPLRLLSPSESPRGVIVYFHGGGWTMGTVAEFDTLGRVLAERTGCAVALVEYRLAPENPYPTAVDDSWAALQWIDSNVETLAGRRVPLIAAGDSAGANLVAVLAIRARDAGAPDLAMQILVCPVTDCDLDNETYRDPANQLIVTREAMSWYWSNYAPDPSLREKPDLSPARASELSNVAPAVMVIAEHDVLRQEGENYAKLLSDAGVPVESKVFAGQMHDFFCFVNVLPGSAEGISFVVDAIDHRLSTLTERQLQR